MYALTEDDLIAIYIAAFSVGLGSGVTAAAPDIPPEKIQERADEMSPLLLRDPSVRADIVNEISIVLANRGIDPITKRG